MTYRIIFNLIWCILYSLFNIKYEEVKNTLIQINIDCLYLTSGGCQTIMGRKSNYIIFSKDFFDPYLYSINWCSSVWFLSVNNELIIIYYCIPSWNVLLKASSDEELFILVSSISNFSLWSILSRVFEYTFVMSKIYRNVVNLKLLFEELKYKSFFMAKRSSCRCQYWMDQYDFKTTALVLFKFIFASVWPIILRGETCKSNFCSMSARIHLLLLLLLLLL